MYADIPECERDIDGCDQHCNNTDGSYECSCDVGFLLANGDACVYGFRLAPDNHTCDGEAILTTVCSILHNSDHSVAFIS